jgi:hypothetical protein
VSIVDFDDTTWADPFVRKLSPTHKLLFLYLWTNRHRSISGIYEIDLDTIVFDTALQNKQIEQGFEALAPKVFYDFEESLVFVVNYTKRQFLRTAKISKNIVKGIENQLHTLPCGHPFIKRFLELYGSIKAEPPNDEPIFYRFTENFQTYPLERVRKGSIDPLETLQVQAQALVQVKANTNTTPNNSKYVQGEPPLSVKRKKELFAEFWEIYPGRDGRSPVGKGKTEALFLRVKDEDIPSLLKAAGNYAKSRTAVEGFAKDPERFFVKDYWRDWIEDGGEVETEAERIKREMQEG